MNRPYTLFATMHSLTSPASDMFNAFPTIASPLLHAEAHFPLLTSLTWLQFLPMLHHIRLQLNRWTRYKKSLRDRHPILGFLVETIDTLSVALFIALTLRYFVVQTSYIPSESMVPTLNVKDRLFVNKFIYSFREPRRGEIVVFQSPYEGKKPFLNTFIGIGGETPFVKRLIGLPGDRIKIEHGVVFINDHQLVLPGIEIQRDFTSLPELIVPDKHYFVLGDNRHNSADSRAWGFVHRDDFRGLAFFTFWPLSDIEWLR